jgi:unsaturated rhamnogalacturonyl hydrolase
LKPIIGEPHMLTGSEKIVFFGDSITNSGLYISYVDTYFKEHYPAFRPSFINLGVSSETASGLSEPEHPFPRPCVHDRLQRALQDSKPDWAVLCYGMNDGIYYPYSDERFAAYQAGMLRLIQEVRESGAKVIIMTPPPFDPQSLSGAELQPAGLENYSYAKPFNQYNDVLKRYSAWLNTLEGTAEGIIPVHTLLAQHIGRKRSENADYISGDGIHPNEDGHWIIAEALLERLFNISTTAALTYPLDSAQTDELIHKLLKQLQEMKGSIKETAPIGIISMENWEWPQGVALFALYSYYKEVGKQEILEYLCKWFDEKLERGSIPSPNVNTVCPMLTLTYLYEETKKESYLQLCREWAGYVMNVLPRAGEGGFQHVVSGDWNEGQLWDDTLYMTVLFLTRVGVLLEEGSYLDESVRQFLVHLKYLTDPVTGLFFHGWTFKEQHHFAEALWARGNSWYTAGLVDYLEMAPLSEGVRLFLLSSLERQAAKLKEVQAEDGMWHTLLTDPTSYKETSATAAFAYGIMKAVRQGYLDQSYGDMGWKAYYAVLGQIDEAGLVHGVSYGTGMGSTLQFYKDIEQCPMPYGQSMAMLMLVEGAKHRKDQGAFA